MRPHLLFAGAAPFVALACATAAKPATTQSAPQQPVAAQATAASQQPQQQQSAAGSRRTPLPADSMEIARKYTRWFYTGQVDSLFAHHSPEAQRSLGTTAPLLSSVAELAARAGSEVNVLEERFVTRNGRRQYWRTATFTSSGEPVLVRWVINSAGQIEGMGLGPKSQAPPIDPQQ